MYRSEKDPEKRAALEAQITKLDAERDRLRDKAPKPWNDGYVSQGAVKDAASVIRGIVTGAGENLVSLAAGAGAAALTGGVGGAVVKGLSRGGGFVRPKAAAGIAVSGASAAGLAVSSGASVLGTEFWELKKEFPEDIAWKHAKSTAVFTGAAEAVLGGVAGGLAKTFLKSSYSSVLEKVMSRYFVTGKMGAIARAGITWTREIAEEGVTEALETG
jgi:hypothetical protein